MLEKAPRLQRTPARVTPSLIAGIALFTLFAAAGLVSFVWTPYDPAAIDMTAQLAPPGSAGHPLGTDSLGRDILSTVMAGARTSMMVTVVSTVSAILPGVLFGLLIAGTGRALQNLFSRLTDVGVAFPKILVALVLATAVGPNKTTATMSIAV